jgi:hypothetical protein
MSERRHKGVAADPENEIVEELADEVEQDGETRTVTDEETIKKEGALNAEAVQSNRRRQRVLDKKRGGAGMVPWNESRAPLLYDDIIAHYPANTLMIFVERLSGTPASWYLWGQPKSGVELYQSILKQCHGRREETEYRVVFRDAQKRFDRGIGRLTIPSTLDDPSMPATPQGLAMQQGIPPQNYGQQPPPQQQPPPPQQQQQAAPQYAQGYPPPQQQQQFVGHSPQETQVLMDIQRQLGELSGRVNSVLNQPQQPQQPQQQPAPHPPPMPAYLHPRFRDHGYHGVVPPGPAMQPQQPQPQQPQAQAAQPVLVPPPGYVIVLSPNGQQMLVPAGQVGIGGNPQQQPQAVAAPQPPARPLTPAEMFRDSIGMMSVAIDAAKTMQSLLPNAGGAAAPAAAAVDEEEETPVKTIKMGDMNVVVNKKDGSARLIETALANGDKIMDWVDKQRKTIQQAQQGQMSMPQMPQQQPQQQAAPQGGGMMPMPQWPGAGR